MGIITKIGIKNTDKKYGEKDRKLKIKRVHHNSGLKSTQKYTADANRRIQ